MVDSQESFTKKFGRVPKYVASSFEGVGLDDQLDQVALLQFGEAESKLVVDASFWSTTS